MIADRVPDVNGLRLITSGLCTTIQDTGRTSFRHLGVPVGGAVDRTSLKLANLLVGNEKNTAAMEMTLSGPQIEFTHDTVFALTGARFSAELVQSNGVRTAAPGSRPVAVRAGCQLVTGTAVRGCRAYLAVAGGFRVPQVLGSCSTLLNSSLPDIASCRLAAGDFLPVISVEPSQRLSHGRLHRVLQRLRDQLEHSEFACPEWSVQISPLMPGCATLRFLPGPHFSRLCESSQRELCQAVFEVRAESDRMGCRLRGPVLEQSSSDQIPSEAVMPGTLQLPADGQILMLMADCAPTGGYPQIGHVIQADWSRMSQLRPGDSVRFQISALTDAQEALAKEQRDLRRAITMAELSV
ncbi:MAG: biotin-dependent carboxyltransferase family protein [Planctomycetaceae bacterium]